MIHFACGLVLIITATAVLLSGSIAYGLGLYTLGGACIALGILGG